MADSGGGRRWELLRCETCGAARSVSCESYEEIGEPVRKLQRTLEALAAADDSGYDAIERTREEYCHQVEADFGECRCSGRMTFSAPIRHPACQSVDVDRGKAWRLYD